MIIRFNGDKSAKGQMVFGKVIGRLCNGTAIDVDGYAICKYRRIEENGGPKASIQEIEFYKEEEDVASSNL
jgi:hypothetical protein